MIVPQVRDASSLRDFCLKVQNVDKFDDTRHKTTKKDVSISKFQTLLTANRDMAQNTVFTIITKF